MIRLISFFFDSVYMKMIDEVPSLLLSPLVLSHLLIERSC